MEKLKKYKVIKGYHIIIYGRMMERHSIGELLILSNSEASKLLKEGFIEPYNENDTVESNENNYSLSKDHMKKEQLIADACDMFVKGLNKLHNKEDLVLTKDEVSTLTKTMEEEHMSKDTIIDYDKNYNIHEVFTLLENMPEDTEVICSFDGEIYILESSEQYRDLKLSGSSTIYIEDNANSLFDLINATFRLVREETWIPCTFSQAVNHFVNNRTDIKIGNYSRFCTKDISGGNIIEAVAKETILLSDILEDNWYYLER